MTRALALIIGIIGHLLFFAAVGLMAYSLYWGLTKPIFSSGDYFLLVNAALLVAFPVGHSLLLSTAGRRILASLLPASIGKVMVTTTFALISSLQVGLFFSMWTPIGEVWFEPHGLLRGVFGAVYAISWLGLIVSIYESGIGLQTGAIGWLAVLNNRKPKYPPLPTAGLHGRCRHPIYQSFLMILVTGPVWGLDHLIVAIVWGLYCLIGPIFKEQRLRAAHGQAYSAYSSRVPYYFLPGFK